MDEWDLKLACLREAQKQGLTGKDAREEADRIYNWIKGPGTAWRGDAGRLGETEPDDSLARVVGRDGDLDKPFKDYIKE